MFSPPPPKSARSRDGSAEGELKRGASRAPRNIEHSAPLQPLLAKCVDQPADKDLVPRPILGPDTRRTLARLPPGASAEARRDGSGVGRGKSLERWSSLERGGSLAIAIDGRDAWRHLTGHAVRTGTHSRTQLLPCRCRRRLVGLAEEVRHHVKPGLPVALLIAGSAVCRRKLREGEQAHGGPRL
eukprot:scaffold16141_cov101-Isochrysis_galbana.AAC.2